MQAAFSLLNMLYIFTNYKTDFVFHSKFHLLLQSSDPCLPDDCNNMKFKVSEN